MRPAPIAALGLVLVAACEPIPDYRGCPVVGYWRDATYDGVDLRPGSSAPSPRGDQRFTDSGVWTQANVYIGPDHLDWRFLKSDGKHIEIEYPKGSFDATAMKYHSTYRTFEMDGSDRMREYNDRGFCTIWERTPNPKER